MEIKQHKTINQLLEDVLRYSWNTTSQEFTHAKVLIGLRNANLYATAAKDAENPSRLSYMRLFWEALQELNEAIDVDGNVDGNFSSELLGDALKILKPVNPSLVHNFNKLSIALGDQLGILDEFASNFRGRIVQVWVINDITVIETDKEDGYFYCAVNGRLMTECFSSLDRALVGAVAYKHEGANGRAASYFFKMIDI